MTKSKQRSVTAGEAPASPTQGVEAFPVEALELYQRNPRRGDVDAIAESLAKLGQYRPIVVNIGTHTGRPREVLAGNHTLLAARRLGWDTINGVTVDVDEDTATRIVLVDNRSADLASNDDEVLAVLLSELPDLEGTGYDSDDLEALLSDPEGDEVLHSADLLADTPDSYREQYAVMVICESEVEQADVFAQLQEQGFTCRVVTT